MGTYFKHKRTESIDVPYSFRCEQCMKDSGTLMATISGTEATLNSNFKQLNDKQQQKLNEMAHIHLVSAVREAHRDATEKQIYAKAFKDECPHCHKPQSWAVSGIKKGLFDTPNVCIILSIILCFAIAAGSLIWNIIKIGRKKKQTASAIQKNAPVIEWGAVQNILDEK